MAEYTYELNISEDKLLCAAIVMLQTQGRDHWADLLKGRKLTLRTSSRFSGDRWNCYSAQITIRCPSDIMEQLRSYPAASLKTVFNRLLPSEAGYDVTDVTYVPLFEDDPILPDLELPQKSEETLQTLLTDISNSLSRDEPTLTLDRLHTYTTKLLRDICEKNGIATKNNKGEFLPLHSLAGSLKKLYENNNVFQSEFAAQAVKISISLFELYNKIRNNHSYAHDNIVLSKTEAAFVVRIMAALISYIDAVESKRVSTFIPF